MTITELKEHNIAELGKLARSLDIAGASGLQRGTLLEHLYREVRAPRIYEGTSEIQREIIARELFRGSAGAGV